MKNQSATYPQARTRTDWSSEVKMPSGNAYAPSGTGIGGMEREAQASRTAMERETQTSRAGMDGMQTSRAGMNGMQTSRAGMNGMHASRAGMNGMQASRTGTDWTQTSGDDWPEANDALSVAEQNAADSIDAPISGPQVMNGQEMSEIWPNIENNLPNDVIEAPTTMEEVYRGSMKALLLRNVGNYVVATFLIGTQTTVSWEGILYDVGNDYIAIYQSGRDQYIVSDLYSLKYVEFYDTRRRELCDSLLTAQEPAGNSQRP